MRKIALSFTLLLVVFSAVFAGLNTRVQAAVQSNVQAASDFADPAFKNVWTRTDSAVGSAFQRSYFWGPAPISAGLQEPYNGGQRLVQYFDKSRMEINNPGGDKSQNFYVTNGLLATELISGKQQTGDTSFKDRWSAAIPLASDPDDGNAPTYYSFRNALDTTADKTGQNATATIDVNGKTGNDAGKASDANSKIAYFEKTTGHNIPAAFWTFLNQSGAVVDCTPAACKSGTVTQQLSNPWFYASGYPISEAYWAKVKIAGKAGTDVLIQAFQRRILTYVPSFDKAFQVQVGNIGAHYYEWLYKDAGKPLDYFTFQPGGATALSGGGATFPDPLYQKWFADYKAKYSVDVNYQAKGSGFGVQNIQQQTLDFGGSDAPMSDAELAAAKGGAILHIPTCLGAVVPIYNLPGVSGTLKLDGSTLTNIYLGKITTWNDHAIAALNSGMSLPASPIQVVYRSDSSGTTFVWTSYLADVSADWKAGPGANKSPKWPIGQGAPGNAGVAGQVNASPFSIGYVELAFAKQNNLKFADVKNKNGKFVTASLASISAAAANLGDIPADLRFSLINTPGDDTYPIASATWQLVYKNQTNKAKAIALVNLLNWELTVGQTYNESLNYGKLPPNLRDKALSKVMEIVIP
jgi:phosphate transport system substrate-binding protein